MIILIRTLKSNTYRKKLKNYLIKVIRSRLYGRTTQHSTRHSPTRGYVSTGCDWRRDAPPAHPHARAYWLLTRRDVCETRPLLCTRHCCSLSRDKAIVGPVWLLSLAWGCCGDVIMDCDLTGINVITRDL